MNKVILMGRLTKDPEVRYSKSDTPMAITRYALAIRRRKGREKEDDADFVNVVAFDKAGEFAAKYFQKGQRITIVGRIHQDKWEDAQNMRHSRFEIIADEQYFADSLNGNNPGNTGIHEATAAMPEDELPF